MESEILKGLQVLNPRSAEENLVGACKQLFIHSDEYCNTFQPFSEGEVDSVAIAIYEFIRDPHASSTQEILFEKPRRLEGRSMDYDTYASMFSQDMAYQSVSSRFASCSRDDLNDTLQRYYVGILFRYQYCVHSDQASFPVSLILNYMEGVRELFAHEHREHEYCDALRTTLEAMQSIEYKARLAKRHSEEKGDKPEY